MQSSEIDISENLTDIKEIFRKGDLRAIPKPLLKWYDNNRRILPWREQPTPYRVWVSEIMLQQTRVEAVKPYFQRFMDTLPDIAALAEASEETLLKLWEGLGYYNRVRNLQKAAIQIMEDYGGRMPDSYEELLNLKGIGSYSKKDKDVVMCACNNKQMYTIKKMVHTIDPKAFTIIVESNEVVGEGFKEELPDIEL